MATTQQRAFLGVGWKFPLQVTPDGKIAQARYETRVEESIYLILSTAAGERAISELDRQIGELEALEGRDRGGDAVVQVVSEK